MSQTGDGPPRRTHSPDGRWWWDGQRWQPVQAAPVTPGRPRPRALLAVAVAIGLALFAVVATATVVIEPRLSPIHAPSPPTRGRYLAAASEAGIEHAATAQGLQCGSPPLSIGFGRPPRMRTCHRASPTGTASVQTLSFDSSHVDAVSADVIVGRPADASDALAFLQSIVDAALPADDAATADAWLRAHFDQPGSTVVNGVELRLVVSGIVRALAIMPAT